MMTYHLMIHFREFLNSSITIRSTSHGKDILDTLAGKQIAIDGEKLGGFSPLPVEK